MAISDQTAKSFSSDATRTKNSLTRRLATATLLIAALLITACAEPNDPTATVSAHVTNTTPTNTPAPESTPIPTATIAPSPAAAPTETTAAQSTSTSASAPAPTTTTSPALPTSTPTPTPIPAATSKPANTPTTTPSTPTIAPQPTATRSSSPTALPTEPTTTPELIINQDRADEGESIYSSNCSGCHSQGPNKIVGPGHENVFETAKTRVTGISPEDYLTQSITDPTAFVVSGFSPIMPSFSFFSDEQILALVEFLKTL